ncbi:hypothetical protein TREMEDRAFT_65418 [Tremella mesenterica DSM 1558]|uniref:uncharacterized protein n=1 Tax=Tremella mesenterica (strain ATCC 24925 / CBS 8224 / DSM 1558 / NBRC 9311 / NRRL Y-6157 / RJB 2259-6 / UBC 559-6) TaxID=578456 RepID=UPI00032CBB4E|nr:uncharacterized protein TREMEDRAFT_65418 [Tremella mesenterica DSM 1558]EIW66548.1 hypothetical protein TREMEDRAFT_65418 [Tremella mesenterica DSM 1558]
MPLIRKDRSHLLLMVPPALRKQPLGQETVGPFPLGVGPGGRSRAWKRWNELGLGGKIWRTTQQTGNITVIALGFGLFAILAFALTTELFAKNSPSVLYSQAVDLIRASNALNPHLLPPLTFTHSPQSSAPVRGSPPLAHRIIRHPHSGRDHLLLTFFVHGRGKDEPETLGWARRWYALAEGYARQAALNLGIVNSPEEEKEILPEIKTVPEKGLNLGNMFGGLSLKPVKVERRQKGTVPPGTYKIGEVRADYVKNASGQFTLLSLVIDIPSSRATHPSRAVVFWSPEADTEGLLGRRA